MIENGSITTKENRWLYFERESRPKNSLSILTGKPSLGKLDHVANSTIIGYGSENTLFLVKGQGDSNNNIGYNNFDFGNFLRRQTGKRMGFGLGTLIGAANTNNAVNGRTDNPGLDTGFWDSEDQKAIKAGYYYPDEKPESTEFDAEKNHGAFKPWEPK